TWQIFVANSTRRAAKRRMARNIGQRAPKRPNSADIVLNVTMVAPEDRSPRTEPHTAITPITAVGFGDRAVVVVLVVESAAAVVKGEDVGGIEPDRLGVIRNGTVEVLPL